MAKITELYAGDKRIDTLEDAIVDCIYERVGGTDITLVAIIGTLESVKYKLVKAIQDD